MLIVINTKDVSKWIKIHQKCVMLTCQVNYTPESEQTNCLNNIPDHQGDVNTTDQLSTCAIYRWCHFLK